MITIPLILPFVPILWGLGVLLGGVGITAVSRAFNDPKVNKLGILGMQASGKTRFLSFLRNIPYEERQTSREKYDSFKYKLSNGNEITISSGVDIGGGNIYRHDYNTILDEADVVLYFFDVGKYLRNEMDVDGKSYQRECNSRFEHIYSKIKKVKKPISIIATHKDKSGFSDVEIAQKFSTVVHSKSYRKMFKNIEYVNLTNLKEIKNLRDKLFKTT